MADRVIVMRNGRAVEHGSVLEFSHPLEPSTPANCLPRYPNGDHGASTTGGQRRHAGWPSARSDATVVASVQDLRVRFDLHGGFFGRVDRRVHAVEGVSFSIGRNETLSLVGESGCGKSTTAKAIAGLVRYSGEIVINGRSLEGLAAAERNAVRRDVQMIFQDPYASLDPRMRVSDSWLNRSSSTVRSRQSAIIAWHHCRACRAFARPDGPLSA